MAPDEAHMVHVVKHIIALCPNLTKLAHSDRAFLKEKFIILTNNNYHMKFYLSSFKLGNKSEELVKLIGKNKKLLIFQMHLTIQK